jgi:hypothetical protein
MPVEGGIVEGVVPWASRGTFDTWRHFRAPYSVYGIVSALERALKVPTTAQGVAEGGAVDGGDVFVVARLIASPAQADRG